MKRIRLKEISEVLSETELKNVVGGSSSKQDACSGKALCASCSWVYDGRTFSGKCSQNAYTGSRYCSDLNCHY